MSWMIEIYNLDFIDKRLKEVLRDKECRFGPGVITSLYRIGDPGVHGSLPLRGLDERCQEISLGTEIADYLNGLWTYDPDRPNMKVCLFHDVGQGLHLHYQVHPKTVRNADLMKG